MATESNESVPERILSEKKFGEYLTLNGVTEALLKNAGAEENREALHEALEKMGIAHYPNYKLGKN